MDLTPLVVAYSVIWGIILLYVLYLNRKLEEIEDEIKLLKEAKGE